MSKFLMFRLRPAFIVLIAMVWMSLHLLWGAANINDMVVLMGGLRVIIEGVLLPASRLQHSFFWFNGQLLAYL